MALRNGQTYHLKEDLCGKALYAQFMKMLKIIALLDRYKSIGFTAININRSGTDTNPRQDIIMMVKVNDETEPKYVWQYHIYFTQTPSLGEKLKKEETS